MEQPREDADVTVYATPCDSHGDDEELLPFWRLYVEHYYRPEWVEDGRFALKGSRVPMIARLNEGWEDPYIPIADIADTLGIPTSEVPRRLMAEGREVLKAYVEAYASKKRKKHVVKVEEEGEAFVIKRLRTPTMAFIDDVMSGKVFDPRTGLKLSLRQAQGRPPEAGFLQEVSADVFGLTSADYEEAKKSNKLSYRRGVVVKICGDYDRELSKHHNSWAVITEVIDAYHYRVVQEFTGEQLTIRDTDIKAIIGDMQHDYIGIGRDRHRREVIPIIRKALAGKIPLPEYRPVTWPRPPLRHALVMVYDYVANGDYQADPRQFVQKALKRARRRLKKVERDKERYDIKDYRRQRGMALLSIKLYTLLTQRLDRLYKREGVREIKLYGLEKESYRRGVREKLRRQGIPCLIENGRLIVLEEDYEEVINHTP